jgi:hypothetical protein
MGPIMLNFDVARNDLTQMASGAEGAPLYTMDLMHSPRSVALRLKDQSFFTMRYIRMPANFT